MNGARILSYTLSIPIAAVAGGLVYVQIGNSNYAWGAAIIVWVVTSAIVELALKRQAGG